MKVGTYLPQNNNNKINNSNNICCKIKDNESIYNNNSNNNSNNNNNNKCGYNPAAIARLIQPSHHLCWLYDNYDELLEFTVQFCIDGITQNYITICHFVDKEVQDKYRKRDFGGNNNSNNNCSADHKFLSPKEVLSALKERGIEAEKAIERGQLKLLDNHEVLLENGYFSADKSIGMFREILFNSRTAGYAGVRAYGDMAFAFGHLGFDKARAFHQFESKVNWLQEDFPEFVGVCCFDRNLFPPFLIKDVLQTHPVAAVKEKYYKYNFYYVPPKKFVCPEADDEDIVSSWLHNLEERTIVDRQMESSISEMRSQNSELRQLIRSQTPMCTSDAVTEALAAQQQSFISNISHEIRTPLTGILGGIDLLTSTMISEEQKKLLQYLLPSVRQLSRVLSDVLAFDQEISLQKAPLILRETVQLSISEAESISAAHLDLHVDSKFDISVTFGTHVPDIIIGDESRIRQVLVNLISNSIKFSNAKINVHIDIRVTNRIEDRVQLRFSIFDNGIGLIAGDTLKIFNAFWQQDQSSNKRYGGTGLGLAITKSLIKLMGGEITASSAGLNRGTCIEFTIWVEVEPTDIDAIAVDQERVIPPLSTTPPKPNLLSAASSPCPSPLNTPRSTSPPFLLSHFPSPSQSPIHSQSQSPSASPSPSTSSEPSPTTSSSSSPDGFNVHIAPLHTKRRASSIPPPPLVIPDGHTGENTDREKEKEKARAFYRVPTETPMRLSPKSATDILAPPKNISILLVEDNAINAKVIMQLLKSLGYAADLAKNGVEAVDATASNRYDVVFMDLHMPIMDGFQATEEILSRGCTEEEETNHQGCTTTHLNAYSSQNSRIPRIFALTASASENDKRKCEKVGMVGHLTKPVSKISLLRALSSLV